MSQPMQLRNSHGRVGRTLRWKETLQRLKDSGSKALSISQNIGTLVRQKCSLATWLGIAITLIIGGLGLKYAYDQQVIAFEAVRLAEWTARKDFREICQEQTNLQIPSSPKCQAILKEIFPEPPYVNLKRHEKVEWRNLVPVPSQSSRLQLQSTSPTGLPLTEADATSLHPWTVLIACGFLAFLNRKVLRRYFRIAVGGSQLETSLAIYRAYKDNVSEAAPHTTPRADLEMPMSTGVETISKGRLRRRGRVSQQKDIWTAAANGDVEEVQRNLDNKVDVHARSKHHSTPLSVAAFHSQPFVAELLLEHDSKRNSNIAGFQENVLHAAATARLLLKYGADIKIKTCDFNQAGAAVSQGFQHLVRTFVECGVNRTSIIVPRPLEVHNTSYQRFSAYCHDIFFTSNSVYETNHEFLPWLELLNRGKDLNFLRKAAHTCELFQRGTIRTYKERSVKLSEGSVPRPCVQKVFKDILEQYDHGTLALNYWDTSIAKYKQRDITFFVWSYRRFCEDIILVAWCYKEYYEDIRKLFELVRLLYALSREAERLFRLQLIGREHLSKKWHDVNEALVIVSTLL